jgi:hypothetical protein
MDAKNHFPLCGTPLCGSKSFTALVSCRGCCTRCEARLEKLVGLLKKAATGEDVEKEARQTCKTLGIALNGENGEQE